MECGIIVPRHEELNFLYIHKGYLPACILPQGHRGPHAFRTPDGDCYAWEDDWKCGCCRADEPDRCYLYWEIEEDEISKLC